MTAGTGSSRVDAMWWYARTLKDHDTHRGVLVADGVEAVCGVGFAPVVLAFGRRGWPDPPPDLDQICEVCFRGGTAPRVLEGQGS